MQISTTEKDTLINGLRDAAVRLHAARAALVSSPSRQTKDAWHDARIEHDKVVDDFLERVHVGLDMSYPIEVFCLVDADSPTAEDCLSTAVEIADVSIADQIAGDLNALADKIIEEDKAVEKTADDKDTE